MSRALVHNGKALARGRRGHGRRRHKGNNGSYGQGGRPHGQRMAAGAQKARKKQVVASASATVKDRGVLPTGLQERIKDMTVVEREEVAKVLGYRQIGAPVPRDVSLVDVIKTFPKEVYELDHWRAWSALALTVSTMVLGYVCVACVPWYLLPFAWFFTGTAATGLFVLGHDCGHHVFHKKPWVNDVVGHVVLTPLIYPYEPWKIMHNRHHVHTNKLHKDTGWHPVMVESAEEGTPFYNMLRVTLGTPVKLWLSIVHWLKLHFHPKNFSASQLRKVQVSWGVCLGFAVVVWSALVLNLGWAGWAKYWLMPWLVYHFWMSTFTLIHHTAPHIPFQHQDDYHGASAKLGGTVHCDFPRWIEVLCHDINVHIPHHLSAKIPFYHLRAATDSLRKNWGQYMTEGTFNWRMMRNFLTEMHLYDIGKEYVSFDEGKKEDPLLAAQRRILPNMM